MESIFDKIGGRKFVMALVLIIAGAAVDVLATNGLSMNLMGLMTAVYATFSASNAFVTNKQLDVEGKSSGSPSPEPEGPSASEAVQKLASELVPVIEQLNKNMSILNTQQAAQSESLSTHTQAISQILTIISASKK